jgi:cytochrome c biogenesis protein CcmG/thiol:disulfide interchange protein DsbE
MQKLVIVLSIFAMALAGCGKPQAPDVALYPLVDGSPKKKLSDFKGKVVLIDNWATWCGPCQETMPIIERLYSQYSPKGLEVVAVTPETLSEVKDYLKDNQVNYPIYLDTDNSVNDGFKVTGIPDCIVIGKDGTIQYRGHPGDTAPLERAIQAALE